MGEPVVPECLRQSMVERVARAMCKAAGDNPDADARDPCDPQNDGRRLWETWEDDARAAIAAMHMPTDAMIEAGRWPAEDDGPVACWQAMIDAALAEAGLTTEG